MIGNLFQYTISDTFILVVFEKGRDDSAVCKVERTRKSYQSKCRMGVISRINNYEIVLLIPV